LGQLHFATTDEGRFGWDIFGMMGEFDRDGFLWGAGWQGGQQESWGFE